MKKNIFISILIILCIGLTQFVNAQLLGKWVLPTNDATYLLSFTQIGIESTTLETLAWDIPCEFAAGGYNPNYDLRFYFLGDLFCYGDNSIEWNSLTNQGVIDFKPEFQIINKPGFNEKFFSFYTIIGSDKESDNHFKYIETQFIDNEPQFSAEYDILSGMPQGVYMAFALTEEFNNEKFLYASAQRSTISSGNILKAGLKKWPVNVNGVDTENMEVILEWDDPDYNFVEDDFSSYNLELKVDNNSNTVIAWISSKPISFEKVFMYFESNNLAQTIDLSQLQPGMIAGIEFSGLNDDIIYISCTNLGIIAYDYQNQEIAEYLTSNGEYGKTFLQTAPDGHIYAVSNNGQHLGRINMQTGNFEPGPEVFSFQLEETVSTYRTFNGENYFILPEHHVPHNYLTVELQTEDVCPGATDGYATITVTNGYINYTYTLYKYINNNWELLETVTIENNLYTFNNLSEGDYKYVVIDGHENTTEGFFSIVVGEDLFDVDEFEDITSYDPAYWNEVNRTYQRGFRIFAGVDVTITNSNLYFGKYARIVIEPGATLTMNNSTLDYYAPCLEKWRGVEVAGVWNQPQIDEYGNYLQGRLSLENGSEISNAENAISLYTCNYPNEDERVILWGSAGGVVQANDALFRNNTKSVHFVPYQNTHPITGDPMLNLSYFKLDTFDINIDYIDHSTFYKHADLFGVKGINFYGCTFTNTASSGVSTYNLGIAAYGAGFTVKSSCNMPPPITDPCDPGFIENSTFNGFYQAIGAYSSLEYIHTFMVDDALFQNNITGVYVSGVDNAVIINSDFHVGYTQPTDAYDDCDAVPFGYGIDIHEAMGFAVENNIFSKYNQAPPGEYAGIRVYWCPSPHDIIYKNSFDGLSFGNFAEGINRSHPSNDQTGVEYQCNCNVNNAIDFIVTGPTPDEAMIRTDHGSIDIASGNTFTPYQIVDYHIWNGGRQKIDWYYYPANPDENPTEIFTLPPGYFEKIESNDFNLCPDHYGGSGGGHIELTASERQQKEVDYNQNLSNYNSVNTLYTSLIDGGNTDAELLDIQTAQPDDMWALRAQLLGDSPHLSQEVLREMSDRTDVFPDDVLLEILSANPDELLKDTLLLWLEQKEYPLPGYMIDILEQAANGITYKTILKREMAQYHAGKSQAAQDIIRSILNDSVIDIVDYRNWLDNLGSLSADKQIITSYFSEDDTSSAISLMNLLPALHDLQGEELDYFNDYKNIMQLLISWKYSGKNIFELDSIDIYTLEIYANNYKSSTARNIARNILSYAYNYNYCECLDINDSIYYKSSDGSIFGALSNAYGPKITVEPNPANTWTAFNYRMNAKESVGFIRITDVSGKEIKRFRVTGKQGQQVWDTRWVKPGIYFYNFIANGLSKSGKIIVY